MSFALEVQVGREPGPPGAIAIVIAHPLLLGFLLGWRPSMVLCPRGTAWGRHETSPPQILASGSRRRRASGLSLFCLGASLSDTTGAHHRAISPRRRAGHRRAPDGSMDIRSARS